MVAIYSELCGSLVGPLLEQDKFHVVVGLGGTATMSIPRACINKMYGLNDPRALPIIEQAKREEGMYAAG